MVAKNSNKFKRLTPSLQIRAKNKNGSKFIILYTMAFFQSEYKELSFLSFLIFAKWNFLFLIEIREMKSRSNYDFSGPRGSSASSTGYRNSQQYREAQRGAGYYGTDFAREEYEEYLKKARAAYQKTQQEQRDFNASKRGQTEHEKQ